MAATAERWVGAPSGVGFEAQLSALARVLFGMDHRSSLVSSARIGALALGLITAGSAAFAGGGNWPQFRGPTRDGLAADSPLASSWPEDGPPVLWRRVAGSGFSGIAVVDDLIYTAWETGERELAVSLDARTGEVLWTRDLGDAFTNERGGGPRSTPTVLDDAVWVLGARGRLAKLDARTGAPRWNRSLVTDFDAPIPIWGISASPLVVGELVVVQVGGENQALVAFDRDTGETVWKAFSDAPSYSSPIAATLAGREQIVALTGQNLVGVSLDGEVLWSHPWPVINDINVATPLALPGDRIFVSTSYDVGAALLQIRSDAGDLSATELWRSRVMKNHFQSSIHHDGHLYGFDNAILLSIEAASGSVDWRTRGFGKGFLVGGGDRLVVLGERGRLALADLDPTEFRERGSVQILDGRCWTPPSLAGGILYLRNEQEILAVDLRPPSDASTGGTR